MSKEFDSIIIFCLGHVPAWYYTCQFWIILKRHQCIEFYKVPRSHIHVVELTNSSSVASVCTNSRRLQTMTHKSLFIIESRQYCFDIDQNYFKLSIFYSILLCLCNGAYFFVVLEYFNMYNINLSNDVIYQIKFFQWNDHRLTYTNEDSICAIPIQFIMEEKLPYSADCLSVCMKIILAEG